VAEFDGVSKRFAARPLIEGLSMRIMRSDRIGLNRPERRRKVDPDPSHSRRTCAGRRHGTPRGPRLNIAYFDQLRTQLDPSVTLADAISPGSDWVQLGSETQAHRELSGGILVPGAAREVTDQHASPAERETVCCSRACSRKPANLLILDEPTNDLDIESLELLEERLQDYEGDAAAGESRPAFFSKMSSPKRWPPRAMGYGASTPAVTATTCGQRPTDAGAPHK
jgi:ATP-binding cassette subfamily F protein uup